MRWFAASRPVLRPPAAGLLLLLALSLPLPAAGPAAPKVRRDMLVSTAWLAAHLQQPDLVVVQVGRSRAAYDAGHVPGARFLLLQEIVVTREGVPNELPPVAELVAAMQKLGISAGARVVLYDDDAGLLAARAYVTLDYLGLGEHAALLDGQWKKWQAEKRPRSTAAPAVAPSHLQPRLQPQVIVGLQAMRDLSWEKTRDPEAALAIVDARPETQYAGRETAGEGQRAGRIPGAASLFWKKTLGSEDDPVLKPAAELRALYAAAGVRPGDLVVTYCHSGMQASHDYFTARYLGYDVRLYDGSFAEWSTAKDTEVEKSPEH